MTGSRLLPSLAMAAAVTLMTLVPQPTGAASYVLASCGPSTGYSYFLPGGAVPASEAGWEKDQIRKGWLKLVMYGDNKIDILYQGAQGKAGSYLGEGYQLIALDQGKSGALLVIAINAESAVDHFLFELDSKHHAKRVVWGSVRGAGNPIQKSSLMVAECREDGQ